MNKFQKVAFQMAEDGKRAGCNIFKDESLNSAAREWYLKFKENKKRWPYKKSIRL